MPQSNWNNMFQILQPWAGADYGTVITTFQQHLWIVKVHKLTHHFCDAAHLNLKCVVNKRSAGICAEGLCVVLWKVQCTVHLEVNMHQKSVTNEPSECTCWFYHFLDLLGYLKWIRVSTITLIMEVWALIRFLNAGGFPPPPFPSFLAAHIWVVTKKVHFIHLWATLVGAWGHAVA
jgi:hypothetical protein